MIQRTSYSFRRIFPLRTFLSRLNRRIFQLLRDFVRFTLVKLRLSGAILIGYTEIGNALLRLNRKSALGDKGTVIELPRDLWIYRSIQNFGVWELEVSRFLAQSLSKSAKLPNIRTALLDIGANTGLVTLQAMNLANSSVDVFLFEPIPKHVSALKNNLKNLQRIQICEVALGAENQQSVIYTEATNHGNSSLLGSIVPIDGQIRTEIQVVDTSQYFVDFLDRFEYYVIKCDTQGMDALILSRIPRYIWQKVETAIIEIWALPEINKEDVERLLINFHGFEYLGWSPNSGMTLELDEIKAFWMSKSGAQKNLYLNRSR